MVVLEIYIATICAKIILQKKKEMKSGLFNTEFYLNHEFADKKNSF